MGTVWARHGHGMLCVHRPYGVDLLSKVSAVPVLDQAPHYKDVWGSGGTFQNIVNNVTRWSLYFREKNPKFSFDRRRLGS